MLRVVGNCCMQTNATTANIVGVSSLFWDKFNNSPFCPKLFLYLFVGPLTFCSTSWSDHLLVHLLAFFDFLPKRFMFPQIIRSTQLDTPCLQQSRKKNTRYDCFFFLKILQGACADVFTRPTLQTGATLLRYALPVTEL